MVEVCNGAGPGRIGDLFVPDSFWGLVITDAADVHDLMCYLAGLAPLLRRTGLPQKPTAPAWDAST